MCYLASLYEKKALESGNWNGIVEVMYGKRNTPYTWKDS